LNQLSFQTLAASSIDANGTKEIKSAHNRRASGAALVVIASPTAARARTKVRAALQGLKATKTVTF